MTVAEQITRAKTDYDEVYHAGLDEGLEMERFLSNNFTDYRFFFAPLIAKLKIDNVGGDWFAKATLETLPMPKHTGKAKNLSLMFCAYAYQSGHKYSYLTVKNIPDFDTSNCENFSQMFYENNILEKVPNINTSKGTNFSNMFRRCYALTEIPSLDTSNGTNFRLMFAECMKLTKAPLLDTSKGTDFYGMFYACSDVTEIPPLDTSNGTNFYMMFSGCYDLVEIPSLDTSKGTDFQSTFDKCKVITEIPPIDTANGTNFQSMFMSCEKLVTIPKINISLATNVKNMFLGCIALENITFEGDIKISGLDFSACEVISNASLMSAINALYDYVTEGSTGTYTLTLGTTNLDKLTDEQKAIATAKGWTLA